MQHPELKNLAARMVESMKLPYPQSSRTLDEINKEAKTFGISPNEILSYVQNSPELMEKVSPSGPTEEERIDSLSKFTKHWKMKNSGKEVASPQFQADLNIHVRKVKNFNFYA